MTIGKVGSRPKPAPDHCAMNELQRSIRAVSLPDAGRTLLGMTTESWRNSIFISSGTNQLFANAICRDEGSNGKENGAERFLRTSVIHILAKTNSSKLLKTNEVKLFPAWRFSCTAFTKRMEALALKTDCLKPPTGRGGMLRASGFVTPAFLHLLSVSLEALLGE